MSFVKTNYSDKTPNKSGLTPIRPGKSPGTEMKHKSGLTPVRPGVPQETRLKSGLTPIRPSCGQNQAKSNNCQKPKLRSGLLPIKPSKMLQYFSIAESYNSHFFLHHDQIANQIQPQKITLYLWMPKGNLVSNRWNLVSLSCVITQILTQWQCQTLYSWFLQLHLIWRELGRGLNLWTQASISVSCVRCWNSVCSRHQLNHLFTKSMLMLNDFFFIALKLCPTLNHEESPDCYQLNLVSYWRPQEALHLHCD